VNIASFKAMANTNVQSSTKRVQSGQPAANTFRSVFGSMAGKTPLTVASMQEPVTKGKLGESILALFNATSLEELESEIDSITGLSDLEGLSSLLPLLEKAGLAKDELALLANVTDIWAFLNAIDKVTPQFFKQLTDALEGKGSIPKQQAVELLTLLKSVELVAPTTDLLMKQEQQLFSLQGNLKVAGEYFEKELSSNNSAKNSVVQLMETKPIVRFVAKVETTQTLSDDRNAEKNPDTLQQSVSSPLGSLAVAKGQISTIELENRNNARNEALIKDMQNIFKRSNFGQTGGTNRLLIKLYPEHLGQVRIELLQNNGIMTARILASTALGKEMLDSQLNQLRSAFLQQNLQVERIDISQTLQDTAKHDREQAFNQHFKKETQETEDKHEQNDEEEMTFQEYLIELEV
jgi:flagellar hook-length control protein FliK